MTDRTELKRLAEAANAVTGDASVDITLTSERGQNQAEIDAVTAFVGAATLSAVLALIAVNERLRKERDARYPFKPFHEPSIGFTGCVICGVYTDHGGLPCPKTRATADAVVGQEMIWCACGDGYPVNSHGAGFMDANNGVCANCDSANQGAEPDLDAPNSLAVLRKALSDLLALYDEDEGCRNLPQYIAGRAAMGKGGQS